VISPRTGLSRKSKASLKITEEMKKKRGLNVRRESETSGSSTRDTSIGDISPRNMKDDESM
jgi:hypothetical protein